MVGTDSMLSITSKVDMARLAPCLNSLTQHIERVNYRLYCYKNASTATFEPPSPVGHGWTSNGELLEPEWCIGPFLPPSLVDIAEHTLDFIDNQESESLLDENE